MGENGYKSGPIVLLGLRMVLIEVEAYTGSEDTLNPDGLIRIWL